MKTVVGVSATCVGIFAAFLLQQALPAVPVLHGARFVLVPLVFCCAALALPFPAMLMAAVVTGLLSDIMYLSVVEAILTTQPSTFVQLSDRMYLNAVVGQVEIALGCSVAFFAIYGSIANCFRPSYLRGRWWPVIPLSVICTWAFLLVQFAMISRRRDGFVFDQALLWHLFAPGFLAGLLAPLLHVVVKSFGALIPDKSLPAEPCSNSCKAHADFPSMKKSSPTALLSETPKDEIVLTPVPGLIQNVCTVMDTTSPTALAAEPSSSKNIMGNDVEMTGMLKFENELVFDGNLDGGILSEEGVLTLEKNSHVKGEVKARTITVHGTVNGNISAGERCELKASSQLIGDVMAPIIIVDAGAAFIGKSKVTSAKTPAIEPVHRKTAKIISLIRSCPVFAKRRNSSDRVTALLNFKAP